MTFDATVNPVVYEGGVPVFIDMEYDTWNMCWINRNRMCFRDLYSERNHYNG